MKGQSKKDKLLKLATYGTQSEKKTKQRDNTIYVGQHSTQTNTNNLNKTSLID